MNSNVLRGLCILIILFVSVSPIFAADVSSNDIMPYAASPMRVKQVESGERSIANAAWWGFDEQDSTAVLQAAVDSGASVVVVPYMGKPWNIRQLRITSKNQQIIFEPGVIVIAAKGAPIGKWDRFIRMQGCENVTLRGYGATIMMRKDDYQKPPYERGEWRHTLAIYSSRNIEILGLTFRESGGDGIEIGAMKGEKDMPYSQDVLIRDVTSDNHHRQGISIISARNLTIENCVLSNTSGTPPMAGIDLEPNTPFEYLENIVIRNSTFENNGGAAITVYLRPLDRTSAPVSVLVENCHVKSGRNYGLGVSRSRDEGPRGTIEFRNCVVENTQKPGALVRAKSANGVEVIFNNVTWRNVGIDTSAARAETDGYPNAPVLILGQNSNEFKVQQLGGVRFMHCRIFDDKDRPAFLIHDGRVNSNILANIVGSIAVHNPEHPQAFELLKSQGVNVQLLSAKN